VDERWVFRLALDATIIRPSIIPARMALRQIDSSMPSEGLMRRMKSANDSR